MKSGKRLGASCFVRQSPDEPDKTRLPIIDIFRAAKSKLQRGTI
jgi:hypothetical protein